MVWIIVSCMIGSLFGLIADLDIFDGKERKSMILRHLWATVFATLLAVALFITYA